VPVIITPNGTNLSKAKTSIKKGKDEQLISTSDLKIGEAMIVVEPNGRWDKTIIARIWNEEGKDATYVNMNNTSCTWTPSPNFNGKRVKLTITHEEVK
jgi:hypothetical protein